MHFPIFQPAVSSIRTQLQNWSRGECEQALVRVVIGVVVLSYFSVVDAFSDTEGNVIVADIAMMLLFMICASGLVISALIHPRENVVRRVMGLVVDVGFTSYAMYRGGPISAPLYIVYLWVAFGNGFRYGLPYLYGATVLAILGFGGVIISTSFWHDTLTLSVGLLLGLLVLPLYVATFLRRLNQATHRAEEASRAKSRFLANMSHEMRTPLNGVIGLSDLLSSSRLEGEQMDFVRTIHSSAESLLAIIDDVLDFSKIEEGKLLLENQPYDLYVLLTSTVRMLRAAADKKGLQVTLTLGPGVPCYVSGSPAHLRQILINLLGNAVKFTEYGRVHMRVEQIAESSDHHVLRFEISDTGIGISEDKQEEIFESFHQADASTVRRFGGTGLGTAIAKQLAHLMGGDIGVESVAGEGSTFWFTTIVRQRIPPRERVSSLDGLSVLLVGDTDQRMEKLQQILIEWGCGIEVVESNTQAVVRIKGRELTNDIYDLTILMPRKICATSTDSISSFRNAVGQCRLPLILIPPEKSVDAHDISVSDDAAVVTNLDSDQILNAIQLAQAHLTDDLAIVGPSKLVSSNEKELATPSLRILVAEDNKTNQKVIAKILERGGYQLSLVDNGDDALSSLEEEQFDVAILDVQMPKLSGLDVLKLYRFTSSPNARTPVIMLTADATSTTERECMDAGTSAFVTKPIRANALLEVVARVHAEHCGMGLDEAPSHSDSGNVVHFSNVKRVHSTRFSARLLDVSRLQELLDLTDRDFIIQLVEDFQEDATDILRELELAVRGRSYDRYNELIHSLKGSSGNIGAIGLFEAADDASSANASQFERDALNTYQKLTATFGQTINALESLVYDTGSASPEASDRS